MSSSNYEPYEGPLPQHLCFYTAPYLCERCGQIIDALVMSAHNLLHSAADRALRDLQAHTSITPTGGDHGQVPITLWVNLDSLTLALFGHNVGQLDRSNTKVREVLFGDRIRTG